MKPKLTVSFGLVLLLFSAYSTVNIFAGEWFSSKINDLADVCFRIGSVEGIALNTEAAYEINLTENENIELLTDINNSAYEALNEKLQSRVGNGVGNYTAGASSRLVIIPYNLEYSGNDNSVGAYVRLRPTSNIGNEVFIGGESVICYQGLFYMDGNSPVSLSRIAFSNDNNNFSYYYYPKPIRKDDRVRLVYALYFPEYVNLPADLSCLDLQVEATYADNNFLAMNWNVRFDGNTALPFEDQFLAEIPYNSFFADLDSYSDYGTESMPEYIPEEGTGQSEGEEEQGEQQGEEQIEGQDDEPQSSEPQETGTEGNSPSSEPSQSGGED